MQLVVNRDLVRNRSRLGLVLYGASVVIFAIGLWSSLNTPSSVVPVITMLSWIFGIGLLMVSQQQLRRWGPRQRQEDKLGQAIKGLDDRYKLYAYLSSGLPDFLLVSPGGVQVVVARHEDGEISCVQDRWKKKGEFFLMALLQPSFGNPSADAQQQMRQVQKVLVAEGLEDVPVSAFIVFTNPKVKLRIEGCSAVVTRLKELRDVLRRAAGKGEHVALNAARVREVQAVFDHRMEQASAWR